MFIHLSLSLSLSLSLPPPPYWHRPCWFTDNHSVPRGWARLPSPPTNGRSRTNNLSSMSVFSSYPCILVFYLDRGCHGIDVISTFCFQDYSLRDPESIMKVMTHSNVVINLVGRDYETRYMCVCVFITWNDLCNGFDSSLSQASLTTITVPEFVVYLELFLQNSSFRNFSFADVHIDGARAIAQAARLAGVKRLIHFSALNANADSASKFLQSKAYGEEVVMDSFPTATIIRPSDTFGHEDRFLNYYASLRVFPFGMVPMWQGGEGVEKRPVYVS